MLHVKTRPHRYAIALLCALIAMLATVTLARPAAAETTQETFIKSLVAGAQQGWKTYQVPASVTISQAILETGWGGSTLSSKYNNYFGIKCSSTASPYQSGCVDMTTTEYDANGNKYTTVASFRTYANPGMSMIDHGYFLTVNSRYKPAFAYSDQGVKFGYAIAAAGYATDPNYGLYLYRLMSQYNLFQYDLGKSTGGAVDGSTPAATTATIVYPARAEVAPAAAGTSTETPSAPPTASPAAVAAAEAPEATIPQATVPQATVPQATVPQATLPPATAAEATGQQVSAPAAGEQPAPQVSSAPAPAGDGNSTGRGLPDTGH